MVEYVIDKDALEASICRDSFYDFVQRFWSTVPELAAVEPIWNWHIEYICGLVQEVAVRQFSGRKRKYDLLINIPPGSTKSTILSVMFPAWCWSRKPSTRIICASYSYVLAMDLSRKCRDVIVSEKFTQLFPGVVLKDDQNTKGYFANTQGGGRICVGTDGTITGFHAEFIVNDDPVNPQEAISEQVLKEANRFSAETLSSRRANKKTSVMMTVMQRLHQNDPSAALLEKADKGGFRVRHVNLPAEIDGTGIDVVRPRKLARKYLHGLLDPVRLDRSTLRSMRIEMGEYGYAAQMLLTPVPPGGGMFKTERFILDQPPPLRHFAMLCRYWDKAGTAKEVSKNACKTAGVLLGVDKKGRYWVLDVVLGQWDSNRREEIILNTARMDTPKIPIGVEQEPGSGGKSCAESTVRNLAGWVVRVDRPTGDKITRADPFSVQVNGGNVYLKTAPWNMEYIEEFKYFPFSKFKDQVDATSGAFGQLTKKRIRIGARSLG